MARKEKSVSNEIIIASLLQHGTIKEAAEAAGIAPRTLYDRLNGEREFRALYAHAKAEILRKALTQINGSLSAAIEAINEIMTDPENNAAVRLQAAQTLLNIAAKFSDRLNMAETTARNEDKGTEIFNLF